MLLRMCKQWVVDPVHRAGPHYISMVLAGLFGIIYPPPSIDDVTFGRYAMYVWLGSLSLGGILCIIGRWRGSRGPKILGLGLILTSLSTYMLALIPSWPEAASNFWLLMSFSFMLLYRQTHVRKCRDADLELRRRATARSDMAADARNDPPLPGTSGRGTDRRALDRGPLAGPERRRLSA